MLQTRKSISRPGWSDQTDLLSGAGKTWKKILVKFNTRHIEHIFMKGTSQEKNLLRCTVHTKPQKVTSSMEVIQQDYMSQRQG